MLAEILNFQGAKPILDMGSLSKLVVAVEENKHFTKGNKVEKAFERVVNEGWLHHENIKTAKEEIQNENK